MHHVTSVRYTGLVSFEDWMQTFVKFHIRQNQVKSRTMNKSKLLSTSLLQTIASWTLVFLRFSDMSCNQVQATLFRRTDPTSTQEMKRFCTLGSLKIHNLSSLSVCAAIEMLNSRSDVSREQYSNITVLHYTHTPILTRLYRLGQYYCNIRTNG